MKKIIFIKDTELCKVGDIKSASDKSAESYVSNGYAEYVIAPEEDSKEIIGEKETKTKIINFLKTYKKPNSKAKFLDIAETILNTHSDLQDKQVYSLIEDHFKIKAKDLPNQEGEGPYLNAKILNNLPKVELPKGGVLASEFIEDISSHIKDLNVFFFRPDSADIVEITQVEHDEKNTFEGFKIIKPAKFITLVEKYIVPGHTIWNNEKKTKIFVKTSMGLGNSNIALQSNILQKALPSVERIFTIPMPIIHEGKLTFPQKGYDLRFKSWMSHNAPEISQPDMSLEDAKKILEEIYQEFCFKSPLDKTNAIAALLTPMLRGLYSKFNARTPVFFYIANRERAGKDYCAGISGITYEGEALEDSAIVENEELRKKITSNLISGRKRLHFANNKGYINSSALEGFVTASSWSDRILGRNEKVNFSNETEISMSGNIGITFSPDLANRCRFINLFLEMEDANSRSFTKPDLHGWVMQNRERILSALYALIRNWFEKNMPSGSVPFSSFPEWSRICSGVMEAAGYDSPCTPDKETSGSLDTETAEMKALFELCYAKSLTNPTWKYEKGWVTREAIIKTALEEELFAYYNFSERADTIKFGLKLSKFINRELSDIKLQVDNSKIRTSRQKFKFTKKEVGNVGIVGNDLYPENSQEQDNAIKYVGGKSMPTLPTMPKDIDSMLGRGEKPVSKKVLGLDSPEVQKYIPEVAERFK